MLFGGVYFGSHVSPPCAFEGVEGGLVGAQEGCKAKICQFGSESGSVLEVEDEDVVELDVPMNNRVTVQVEQRLSHLPKQQPPLAN